jgi:hypothetical protein
VLAKVSSAEDSTAERMSEAASQKGLMVAACVEDSALSKSQWRGIEDGTEQGGVEVACAARTLEITVEWLVFGDSV